VESFFFSSPTKWEENAYSLVEESRRNASQPDFRLTIVYVQCING